VPPAEQAALAAHIRPAEAVELVAQTGGPQPPISPPKGPEAAPYTTCHPAVAHVNFTGAGIDMEQGAGWDEDAGRPCRRQCVYMAST
jgi:hypothetical protein